LLGENEPSVDADKLVVLGGEGQGGGGGVERPDGPGNPGRIEGRDRLLELDASGDLGRIGWVAVDQRPT
jgi:hypothetical protein